MDKEKFKFQRRLKRTLNNPLYGCHFDSCFRYSRRNKICIHESCRHGEIHKMWRCEIYLHNTEKCLWDEDCDVTSTNQPANKLCETRAENTKTLSLTCLIHTIETTTVFFIKVTSQHFSYVIGVHKSILQKKYGVAPFNSVTDTSMSLCKIWYDIFVNCN